MEEFTFVLPVSKEDLLVSDSSSKYVVQGLCSPNDIAPKLGVCRSSVVRCGSSFILEHFDTLFSVVYHANNLDVKYVLSSYKIIIKGLENFCESVPAMMEENFDAGTRKKYLNVVRMLIFLFSEILRALEEKFDQNAIKEMAVDAKSRKRAAKAFTDFDWDGLRGEALIHLYNFVNLPLQKLWDPPIADEDFVNLAAGCCYKLLEDPQIVHVRLKNLRDCIHNILGTLVQRYNHGLSCTVKIVQLLKLYEHLASPLAETAVVLVRDYSTRHFIREVIKELCEAEMAFDASAPKASSPFLLEIAQIAPKYLLPTMPLLIPNLESDSYMMRNCVLGVMGEIISSSLCEENLTEEQKETRDMFFEHLEEHLLDLNAYVRCKVLKIWQRLCQEKAIPLSRLNQLMTHITLRLKDNSWSVTRYAIQLYCALLQCNPFGAKLELEKLQQKLHDEEIVLASMEKELQRIIPPCREKQWQDISPAIEIAIQDALAEEENVDEVESGDSLTDNIKLVARWLDAGEYRKAFKLLKLSEQIYPQSKELKANRMHNMQVDFFLKLLKKIFVEFDETQEDGCRNNEIILTAEQKEAQEKILKQRALSQYFQDCIGFATQLEKATEVINNLLLSAQPAVIQDALEYLTAAHQFGLQGAMDGVRNMLLLVWSSESSVKEAVATAYKTLYLEIAVKAPGRSRADEIVKNLSTLLNSLDEDQQAALEVLVKEWVKNDELDKECIQIMWERFSLKLPNTTEEESRAALILLTMVGAAETTIISSNIDVLVTIGLIERGSQDFKLAKETCRALLKLVPENCSVISNDEPIRFKSDHVIFQSLYSILTKGVLKLDDNFYTPFAYEAIDVIYQLSEHPHIMCADLLNHFSKLVRNNSSTTNFDGLTQTNANTCESESKILSDGKVSVEFLNRFVFVIGHIAFRQWVHLDRAVFRELKRRNRIRDERKEKLRGDAEKKSSKDKRKSVLNLNSSILSRASETPRKKDSADSPSKKDKEDAADTEIGELNADDGDAEAINQVCETELACNKSLLATLCPVVVTVCTNPQKYPSVQLRATASLALTKLMLVSSVLCEEHLPLVFTMLEKSVERQIRSNLVYAVGDLFNRFPNLLEPWSKHLYARLQDESPRVRLDTIVVLKHLITNEMVKVRGQISDMAVCIVDSEERISVMASQLFHDLSKKGNTLYNVLPEIISKLSSPESGLTEEHFHTILEFLIPLISKDKQMESLVDKLTRRLKDSIVERLWRDIAFCLSRLQYSERSLRRLIENFDCLSDKFHSPEVREAFDFIINSALKTNKPEKKVLAEELKKKIEETLSKGTGEEQLSENNADDEVPGEGERPKAQAARADKKKSKVSRDSNIKGKRKGDSKSAAQRRKKESSSEEQDESDRDKESPAVKSRRRRRRT